MGVLVGRELPGQGRGVVRGGAGGGGREGGRTGGRSGFEATSNNPTLTTWGKRIVQISLTSNV